MSYQTDYDGTTFDPDTFSVSRSDQVKFQNDSGDHITLYFEVGLFTDGSPANLAPGNSVTKTVSNSADLDKPYQFGNTPDVQTPGEVTPETVTGEITVTN